MGYIQAGLTILLGISMLVIIIYYYRKSIKKSVEQPKYDMLLDDEESQDARK